MSPPARASRLASAAVASLVGLAACAPTGPTPAPTSDPSATPRPAAEVFAEIRSAVETIRGLKPETAVDPVTISVEQLATNLAAEFDAENDPALLADTEAILVTLGLLPPGSSIRDITLDFQAGQVAGYYSPDQDKLFVVDRGGRLDASARVTYAHEYVHQLQDQDIGLDRLPLGPAEPSDRSHGVLALVEGDAVSVQTTWMQDNLGPEEMGELLAVALSPESIEALRRAPAFVRETTLFSYQDGTAFVSRLLAEGGYEAVNAAYESPPDSTEQVLHPDAYLEGEAPVAVSIPDSVAAALGAGWSDAEQDTFGELILQIWLREGGVTLPEARAAAAGWGGDRLVLLRGPDGAVGVGLVTEWDSIAEAGEFASAARAAVADGEPAGRVRHVSNRSTVILGFGDRAADIVAALGG